MIEPYIIRRSGEYMSSPARSLYEDDDEAFEDGAEAISLTRWDSRGGNEGSDVSSIEENEFEYTREEEDIVIRKLDRRLVLLVAVLYMFSFLDRSNIGNAKAAGLEKDLDLSEAQFHWILDGFYVTYILFEFMTICYRLFPAHVYITVCVTAMGAIAALQSLTTGFLSMLCLRLSLGIAEAAFGPGIPFYLSFFFRRDELARRTGIFIAAAPLANTFSGSLAWVILRVARSSKIDGWRLLFIAEGFPNIILALVAWHIIPDSPFTANWLTPKERHIASHRLQIPSTHPKASSNFTKPSLSWWKILQTLKDPTSYLLASILFSLNVAFSSLPVFLPTIVSNMGFSPLSAQGLSAFPNLAAFASILLTAHISDRHRTRSWPLVFHALLAAAGYATLALAPRLSLPHVLRYACLFPLSAGFFSAVTMVIVWTVNNQESDEGKAVGSSVLQVFGHVGSLLGQQLYADEEAPDFVTSHAVCAGFMVVAAGLAVVLRWVLGRENVRRRAQWEREEQSRNGGGWALLGSGGGGGDYFEYML